MRFINEFNKVPTEALVDRAGTLLRLDIRNLVDEEHLATMGAVILRRIRVRVKAARTEAGDAASGAIEDAVFEGYTDAYYDLGEAIKEIEAAL